MNDVWNAPVKVSSQTSTQKEGLSLMPQGTVFGPLLFLDFINDLPGVVKTSDAWLFADDCLLYRHIRNDKDFDKVQSRGARFVCNSYTIEPLNM